MIATGIAVAGIAAAAGGIAKAKIQSNAAKKATSAQVSATNDASRYVQQGMGQLGQLYSPYVNSGASAIGTIGRLTTPGPGARFASPGPPNAMPSPYGGPPQFAPPGYGMPGMPPPQYAPQQAGGGAFGQMAPPPPRMY